jgi:hypothetical protein
MPGVALRKVISGGQTGADQAGLRAARLAGIGTGGHAPRGWLTETGPAPGLRAYGLMEHPGGYAARTTANVRSSDATLAFEAVRSAGTDLTCRECERLGRPLLVVVLRVWGNAVRPRDAALSPRDVADWLTEQAVATLNVAGNREGRAPGIGACVEAFLVETFALPKGG